jgi:hypothetical protein
MLLLSLDVATNFCFPYLEMNPDFLSPLVASIDDPVTTTKSYSHRSALFLA